MRVEGDGARAQRPDGCDALDAQREVLRHDPIVAHGGRHADGGLLARELHAAQVELELARQRREDEGEGAGRQE